MLYRSPWTRYLLAAAGTLAGALLTFGDGVRWRSTPSLHWLARFPLPLQAWGVAFLAYALLLLLPWTRAAGFAVGAFLFAVFTVSLIATVSDGAPKNVVAIVALIDVVVFHLYSIRTATLIRLAVHPQASK